MSKLYGCVLLFSIGVGACNSAANEDSQVDLRPLDAQYPARITLSDAGEFYANAMVSISRSPSGSPQGGATVTLSANARNFSKDTSTEAYREGRLEMVTEFGIPCTATQCTGLGRGETVPIGGDGVTYGLSYGEPGREIDRNITTVRLSTNTDHTVTLVIALAPGFAPIDPALPPTDSKLGTAESMTVTGQMPVNCFTGVMDDPNFTTEFYQNALDEFGLRAIREAQL
jgi:hypothetical protein